MFGLSASLVDNAWQDLQRRGMTVTTIREPGWKWFSEEQYRARVRRTAARAKRALRDALKSRANTSF